jgi:tetratricopeptide (TPR) repeat protein
MSGRKAFAFRPARPISIFQSVLSRLVFFMLTQSGPAIAIRLFLTLKRCKLIWLGCLCLQLHLQAQTEVVTAPSEIPKIQKYLGLGMYREASAALDRAIKSDEFDGDLRYLSGVAFRGLGKFDAAAEELTLAVRLDPRNWRAVDELAQVYAEKYASVPDNTVRIAAFEADKRVASWVPLPLWRGTRPRLQRRKYGPPEQSKHGTRRWGSGTLGSRRNMRCGQRPQEALACLRERWVSPSAAQSQAQISTPRVSVSPSTHPGPRISLVPGPIVRVVASSILTTDFKQRMAVRIWL